MKSVKRMTASEFERVILDEIDVRREENDYRDVYGDNETGYRTSDGDLLISKYVIAANM